MTWVLRAVAAPAHTCDLPMREQWINIPSASMDPNATVSPLRMPDVPDGQRGDLWRCDGCGRLWRVDYPPEEHRGGYQARELRWLPATWWQRWRHRPDQPNG